MDTPEPPAPDPIADATTTVQTFLAAALHADAPDLSDAEALRASLAAVDGATSFAHAEVMRIVRAERGAFEKSLAYAGALRGELGALQADVRAVPQEAVHAQLQGSLLGQTELQEQLGATRTALVELRALAEVHRLTAAFDAALGAARLHDAAGAARGVRAQLERLEAHGAREEVCAVLRARCEADEARVLAAARAAWAAAALGGGTTVELSAAAAADGLGLGALLAALHRAGALEEAMEELAAAVHARLVAPLAATAGSKLVVAAGSSAAQKVLSVKAPPPAPRAGSLVGGKGGAARKGGDDGLVRRATAMCEGLERVAAELQRFVSGAQPPTPEPFGPPAEAVEAAAPGDAAAAAVAAEATALSAEGLMAALGAALWPRIVTELTEHCLLPAILDETAPVGAADGAAAAAAPPADPREAVAAAAVRVRAAEAAMRSARLAPPDSTLGEYATRLQMHAASHQADALLSHGRDLILEKVPTAVRVEPHLVLPPAPTEAAITEETGAAPAAAAAAKASDGAAFLFASCEVSERALSLVRLVRGAMGLAATCDAAGATVLYARARDLIDLFCAAAPAALGDVRRASPHAALLLRNDCELLGHACLFLGAEVAATLPPPLDARATFVDLADALVAVGAGVLDSLVGAQRAQLLETVASGGDFCAVGEEEAAGAAATGALKRLAHEMKRLRATWGGTLPPATARVHLAALLDAPLGALLGALLALRHISGSDCATLGALLAELLPQCDEVLATADAADGGGLAPSLQRLRQLAALLDAAHRSDLPAVQALHSSGALGAFRAAEVLSLYGALFAVQSAAARAFARELQAAAQAET